MSHQINLRPRRAPAAHVRWPARQMAAVLAGVTVLTVVGTGVWVMQLHARERAAVQQSQTHAQTLAALQKQITSCAINPKFAIFLSSEFVQVPPVV